MARLCVKAHSRACVLRIDFVFAEFSHVLGSHSIDLAEHAIEVGNLVKACFGSDLCNGLVGGLQ